MDTEAQSAAVPRGRRLFAVLAAFVFPGTGQLALGHLRRGLTWAPLVWGVGTLGFVGAMALDQPMLVSGAMGGAMLLHLASGLDALRLPPAARLPGWGRALLGSLAIMALGLAGGQLNRRFLVETFRVPSGSMIPTLQVGDTVFARKTAFVPARGEVVVFRLPSNPSQSFIKRVAAVGGDRVQVCGGEVRINDEPLRRQLQADPCTYQDDDSDGQGPPQARSIRCTAYREWNGSQSYLTVFNEGQGAAETSCAPAFAVPAGHVFVLGDNRDNSHDSRHWGSVPPDLLIGRAWFIGWTTRADGLHYDRLHQRVHGPASAAAQP